MDLEGNIKEKDFYGFQARVLLHEMDHLRGAVLSNIEVCKGKMREKYSFIEVDKVNKRYEEPISNELNKLEMLYKSDKKFKLKADSQADKKEFFMRLVLGNEKYEEYTQEALKAMKIDIARGKNPKPIK